MIKIKILVVMLALSATIIAGCTGRSSFSLLAREGDTVALAIGWHQELQRSDISVEIVDSLGNTTIYGPDHPAVRAVVNMYPDPVSRLIVERQIAEIAGIPGFYEGEQIESFVTGGDREYSQSLIILDLPSSMEPGLSLVDIKDLLGESILPGTIRVNIVSGMGESHSFAIWESGFGIGDSLSEAERIPHHTITFSGGDRPHAIQINMDHDAVPPDSAAYVVNARGDRSIAWNDDGSKLRVIIMPAYGQSFDDLVHFKFYVAGVTGLSNPVVSAYDENGIELFDVSATIE